MFYAYFGLWLFIVQSSDYFKILLLCWPNFVLSVNHKPKLLPQLRTFPLAELKEEHYNQLQYQLPPKHTKLPLVFREMERAKSAKEGNDSFLEDYSITQTTLDEVS